MSAALWADDELVFPPDVQPLDLATFLRAIAGFRPGADVTVDAIRDELVAGAQFHPNAIGACAKKAADGGWLASTDRTVRSTRPERRGGWSRVWVRTSKPVTA